MLAEQWRRRNNYTQSLRAATTLSFWIKRFHKFLFDRKFVLHKDHEPHVGILRQDKSTVSLAAARVQKWYFIVLVYHYTLKYSKSTEIEVVDALLGPSVTLLKQKRLNVALFLSVRR